MVGQYSPTFDFKIWFPHLHYRYMYKSCTGTININYKNRGFNENSYFKLPTEFKDDDNQSLMIINCGTCDVNGISALAIIQLTVEAVCGIRNTVGILQISSTMTVWCFCISYWNPSKICPIYERSAQSNRYTATPKCSLKAAHFSSKLTPYLNLSK